MNIKDYLHFYRHCKVLIVPHDERNPYIDTIYAICGDESVSLGKCADYYFDDDNMFDLKPILRPLSDMTEDEFRQEFYDLWLSELDVESFEEQYEKVKSWPIQETGIAPKSFHFLLSKQFDIFGLIDAGLAIDKTKLNNL